MGPSTSHLDRLLPRHQSTIALDLTWDVKVNRFRRSKEETSAAAIIRDISLEGALVEVADSQIHAVGDKIAVRFDGLDGTAVVRHCRPSDDAASDAKSLLYGVRFLPDAAFIEQVCTAVGKIRGHSDELSLAWNRRN